jgi:rhodanese-related sulfurtransferase
MLVAASILALFAACSSDYDFRSDDRPVYERAIDADQLAAMKASGAVVLDVRLLEDFDADPVLIPDATYRNPEDIESWAGQISPVDGPVVVYCVRGKWVSQKAATYLSDAGFDVYTLDGGIEAWKSAGNDTRNPGL